MKKRLLRSLFLLGMASVQVGSFAAKNTEDPVLSYLEEDENIVINKDVEKITFSKNSQGVSAKYSVQKYYKAVRHEDSYMDAIPYNEESSQLKIFGVQDVTYKHSSNMIDGGVFFDGMNLCSISMEFEEKGDVCGYKYDQDFPEAIYLARLVFSEAMFVEEKSVTIEVPSWLDLEIKEYAFDANIKKEVTNGNNKTIYTYKMNNVKCAKDEKHSPSPLYHQPNIIFVYKSVKNSDGSKTPVFETAQDQYKWYSKLLKENKENLDSISGQTKLITSGCKNNMEKVGKIFEWVQQNIRYIAFENGINGFKPHTAAKVLDNKYGDCKGMANLIKHMLKSEGIDGRMVWLGTSSLPYDYTTPSLAVDNHAICAAIMGKDTIYLDATCEYSALKEYPSSIEGQHVMIENGDNCILTRIPANKPHDNLDSTYATLNITENALKGEYKNFRRGQDKISFLNVMDDDFTDVVKSLNAMRFKGLPDSDDMVKITNTQSSDKEVTIAYPIELTNNLVSAGGEYMVSMELDNKASNMSIDMKDRKTDLSLGYKASDALVTELTIPNGYKVSYTPANLSIDKPNYKFTVTYTKKGNKIIYHRSIIIKKTIIPLAEIPAWNKDLEALKSAYMEMVVLKK